MKKTFLIALLLIQSPFAHAMEGDPPGAPEEKSALNLDNLAQSLLDSQLASAVSSGDLEHVQQLLQFGANIETTGSTNILSFLNCTPLRLAICRRDASMCKLLIAQGADINAQTVKGETPLMYALWENNEEIVNLFIDAGARVNQKNNKGITALMKATYARRIAICGLLLRAKAHIDAQNENGDTALLIAVNMGYPEICAFLIDLGADIYQRNVYGDYSLKRAKLMIRDKMAQQENFADYKSIRMILKRADASTKNLFSHMKQKDKLNTQLLFAAQIGNAEWVQELLAAGAWCNARDISTINSRHSTLNTPLIRAAEHNREPVCRLLLAAGADLHIKAADGQTALIAAAGREYEPICALFIEHQRSHDQGIVTALMCIKKLGEGSLYARSFYRQRNNLLAPYLRPYLKNNSLKALLDARDNEGKTAFDYLPVEWLATGEKEKEVVEME